MHWVYWARIGYARRQCICIQCRVMGYTASPIPANSCQDTLICARMCKVDLAFNFGFHATDKLTYTLGTGLDVCVLAKYTHLWNWLGSCS